MKSYRRAIGSIAFVVLASVSFASQAQQMNLVPYVSVDLVQLSTKVTDNTGLAPAVTGTAKTPTVRVRGGVNVFDWLAGEIHIFVPRTDTYSTTATDNTAKSSITGFYLRPNYTLGPVNAYALVGFASAYITLDGQITGKQRASGASYGAGLQYLVTKNWAVSLDYMHYYKESFPVVGATGNLDIKGDAVGLGVSYTFTK